jgi:molybdenum cofactor cytidylyltransferase
MLAFHNAIIPMNASSPATLRVVILAAGFSARLGQPKALARIHGLNLLRRALQAAAGLGVRPVIIIPRHAVRYRLAARASAADFVENSHRAAGLSSSVRLGIRAARYAPAVLLMPVDLCELKERELEQLVRRWQAARRKVVARRIESHGATPLVLPRRLFARAANVVGDTGLRELLTQLPANELALVNLPSAAFDIDTAQDLRAARTRFGRAS